jgi:NADH-quinone oxidoreductase subunit L
MDAATSLPLLLGMALVLPLLSFAVICVGYSIAQFAQRPISVAASKIGAYIACGAISIGFICSLVALGIWLGEHPLTDSHGAAPDHARFESQNDRGPQTATGSASGQRKLAVTPHPAPPISPFHFASDSDAAADSGPHDAEHPGDEHESAGHDHANPPPEYFAGDWYTLCEFGKLKLSIGYHIDALTIVMFCMVTLIASCVHYYAIGYMHDELTDEWTDPEVTLSDGEPFKRVGRFHRFFQYLSLFSFSMLGVVVSGNMAMTFVFWELVGICSYFLIGFYIERKSASDAANKAFIVNRVGDFGMLIGMMALWASLGTFTFGDIEDDDGIVQPGLFSLVRSAENDYRLAPPAGMVKQSAQEEVAKIVLAHATERATDGDAADAKVAAAIDAQVDQWRNDPEKKYGHWLLFIAGVGIFCGCVGKSAQFPLHVWLPDAMEGPTPVSALVHSATMVAAGVFLVGRFYPVFTPEALLVIAYTGCITLFLAATIAITATDIKRVLAYSTVSQLGYMMLALGVGGWVAGLFHLITHAFFKGLLFLCSGSVIHAVHSNEMTDMGGLRKKMPITAYTMLVGCLAIIGAGIPFVIGFSGYYSKDAILEQAYLFMKTNPAHGVLFFAAAGGAAITAFYMFRLWYMTFAGKPRDQHRYDHAHESPRTMTVPLLILAFFAVVVGWTLPGTNFGVSGMLEEGRPVGTLPAQGGALLAGLTVPNEHDSHLPAVKVPVTIIAFSTALGGFLLATIMYCWKKLDAEEVRQQFPRVYRFLWHKWWFDELYDAVFVKPTHFIARRVAQFDLGMIDWIADNSATLTRKVANAWDAVVDRGVVDGTLDATARNTWNLGLSLRRIQTGRLRQYIMFIALGTVALFVAITFVWSLAAAG